MKILLTGGGSGGHFYPIIAVTQSLNKIIKEKKLADVELFFMSPQPYDERSLFDNNLKYIKCPAGKMRIYFSLQNFIDYFRTGWGIIYAIWTLFRIYPDVVFGKGGYVSFPALVAARFLRIPVVIHESDSYPGRANMWARKFARRIAVSYPESLQYFPGDKVAYTGNPIRKEIIEVSEGGDAYFGLEKDAPVILVLGGSQGAELINENLIDALPKLIKKFQIIHQTGAANLDIVKATADLVIGTSEFKQRYKPVAYLNNEAMRMAAGAAQLIISRAGSTIFEIALWGIPSILIPITNSNGNHQRKNAYSYARSGAADVIEENNLTGHILYSEVERIMQDKSLHEKMHQAAQAFAKVNAADVIAEEIITIALEHQS